MSASGSALLAWSFVLCAAWTAAAAAPASFSRDVAPILAAKCVSCHGAEKPKGRYQLHTYEKLMQRGASGQAPITPGEPDRSELFRLLIASDEDERMPQKDDPLPAAQIALIRRWIAEGAKFDGPDPQADLATLLPALPHPEPPAAYPHPVPVLALAFAPDGRELAAGGYHEVTVWNPTNGALLRRIPGLPERVHALAWSAGSDDSRAGGATLAAAGGNPGKLGEVLLLDPAGGRVIRSLARLPELALDVKFSPDGAKLAVGGADKLIRLFDVATGREERRIETHADWVLNVAWSPDGAHLASASRDGTARVTDTRTGELEATYIGHGAPVFAVAFSADGKRVLSAGRDRKVHLWNAPDGKKTAEISGFEGDVFQLLNAEDRLFSCGADRQVRVHGVGDQKLQRTLSGHADWVYALAWHPGAGLLAGGAFDGEVRVWKPDTGELVTVFRAAPGLVAARAGH